MAATTTSILAQASAATASISNENIINSKAPDILYQTNPNTVIVGMWPAGLFATFKLLQAGHNVTLIDNRTKFTRPQRIVLQMKEITTLFHLSTLPAENIKIGDHEHNFSLDLSSVSNKSSLAKNPHYLFFAKLQENKNLLPIKDLQDFLYGIICNSSGINNNVVDKTIDSKTVSDVALDNKSVLDNQSSTSFQAQIMGRLKIYRGSQFQIAELDGDNQTVTLIDTSSKKVNIINFQYFIAADGAKHPMANLLGMNPKYVVTYEKLPKPRHVTCGSIAFSLKAGVKMAADSPKTVISHLQETSLLKPEHLDRLKKLGWEEAYLPVTYIARDDDNVFYTIGELPSQIGKDIQARGDWAKTILSIEYGLQMKDLIYHAPEDSITNPVFQIDLEVARDNVIALGKKGGFFLAGDARQNPNFFYGHGVEDAISDVELIFQCFDEANHTMTTRDEADKNKNLYLNLEAILAQHQEHKAHYLALHKAFSDLLKVKAAINLPKAKQVDALQKALKVIEDNKLSQHDRTREKRSKLQAVLAKRVDFFRKKQNDEIDAIQKNNQTISKMLAEQSRRFKEGFANFAYVIAKLDNKNLEKEFNDVAAIMKKIREVPPKEVELEAAYLIVLQNYEHFKEKNKTLLEKDAIDFTGKTDEDLTKIQDDCKKIQKDCSKIKAALALFNNEIMKKRFKPDVIISSTLTAAGKRQEETTAITAAAAATNVEIGPKPILNVSELAAKRVAEALQLSTLSSTVKSNAENDSVKAKAK